MFLGHILYVVLTACQVQLLLGIMLCFTCARSPAWCNQCIAGMALWLQISSKQLRDDLMTMLIAGHETTAAVLTWTVYCLTSHPEVVARLHQEVTSPPLPSTTPHLVCTTVPNMAMCMCSSHCTLHAKQYCLAAWLYFDHSRGNSRMATAQS